MKRSEYFFLESTEYCYLTLCITYRSPVETYDYYAN